MVLFLGMKETFNQLINNEIKFFNRKVNWNYFSNSLTFLSEKYFNLFFRSFDQTVPQFGGIICLYTVLSDVQQKNSPDMSCGMAQNLGITQNKILAGF